MSITPLPIAPSRSRPATFSSEADALLAALPIMVSEFNGSMAGESAAALALNLVTNSPSGGTNLITHNDTEGYWSNDLLREILASIGARLMSKPTGKNLLFLAVPTANIAGVLAGSTDIGPYINTFLSGLTIGTNVGQDEYYLPPSNAGTTYKLATTITFPNSLSQIVLRGAGRWATRFEWTGAAGVPMIQVINGREVMIRDIGLNNASANKPSAGINFFRTGAAGSWTGSGAPTACSVTGCDIGGGSADAMDAGILFSCTGGSGAAADTNNDNGYFANNYIRNCKVGYSFEHSNALAHNIVGGAISNASLGAFNNYCGSGTLNGGSFTATGVLTGGNALILRMGPTLQYTVTLNGHFSEADTNFISTPSPITGAVGYCNVVINGGTFKFSTGGNVTFDVQDGSNLSMFGVHDTALTTLSLPTAGRALIEGGRVNVGTFSFNGEIVLRNVYSTAGVGGGTVTNLGTGKLRRLRSSGAADATIKQVTTGTSIDCSTLWGESVIVLFGGATNLATLTNAVPDQIVTIIAGNANCTVVHGTSTDQPRLNGNVNFAMGAAASLTLKRGDAALGNSWFEIGRKT